MGVDKNSHISYIIIEAALSILTLLLFLWLCIVEANFLVAILALVGSIYFWGKIILGIKLIIDIVHGPEETETVFMGNALSEKLDFFWKVKYSYVYFDDSELHTHYLLFDDSCSEDIFPGDKVILEYYKRSRIIVRLCHA